MEKEQESVDSFVCPSFSTYSCNKLDDIAEKVLRAQNDNVHVADEENDFEFVALRKGSEGFFVEGGNSNQNFPIFNREILTEHDGDGGGKSSGVEDDTAEIRIPLRKLLIGEEKHGHYPSSSSEEDELDSIPADTYCVWTPKTVKPSPGKCKKSNSTGSSSSSSSSKRWKLLSLLRRSNSDGKESLVLLTPSSNSNSNSAKKKEAKGENRKEKCVAGKNIQATVNGGERKVPVSAHEAFYLRKRENRRKSYLPYKQNLVGFSVRLNAIGSGFPLHF